MSVKVKYKGNEILTSDTDESRKLLTSGKYLEGDVIIENKQDGGITPTGSINITENGTYDVTDKAEAVVEVQGGESDPIHPFQIFEDYAININLNTGVNQCINSQYYPDELILNFKQCETFENFFYDQYAGNLKKLLTITSEKTMTRFSLRGCPYETVNLNFDLSSVVTYSDFLRTCKAKYINGVIDYTSGTTLNNNSILNDELIEIRYKENSLNYNNINLYTYKNVIMSDESVISMINAFKENVANTITFAPILYDRLPNIVGESVLDESGTFHNFVADEEGTTTLLDFATNVKGWTIVRR